VQGPPFDPTLDEERALARFLLMSPPNEAQGRRADEYRLKKIGEIAALDPTYPRHLARGVVLYHLGQFADAADAFQRHLDVSPEGAHTLRAQNYLRAALGRARGEDL
jgi:tetratricopeptide (TPR) repeat protein